MPGPDVGETGLQTEEGVEELGFELVLALLVIGQAGLDGQHADITAFPGEPLDEIEADARLLHDIVRHQGKELERAGRCGVSPDHLELEIEERRLGAEAAGSERSE